MPHGRPEHRPPGRVSARPRNGQISATHPLAEPARRHELSNRKRNTMPQAKIYGLRERLQPVREKVSDAVNEAISDAFKFPRERRLQRFFLMDREDFIFPAHERSDRYTIIEFETFAGRSPE